VSGFCGVISFSQPLERGLLDSPMVVLAPFGGNGSGIVEKQHFALGHHLRLDTPESINEQQPLKHPSRDLYIVADAWLDNRANLCQALSIREVELPNSRLILAAYEKWGEQCPERLLGDFTFAIWDEEKRTLFCARDPIGSRPFYYYMAQNRFYFTNDIEALLSFEAIPPKLDLRFTRGRLEDRHYFHPEHTPFNGVKKLPFAHKLQVSAHGLRLEAHWQPENVAPIRLESEAAYTERLLELLDEAIRCRSRSLYQVGSHISGGLDSSTVTVLAARQHRAENLFQTFTWTFPPSASDYPLRDERKSIEAVAQAENLKVHYTALDVQAFLTQFSQDETRHPQHTLLAERIVGCNAKLVGVKTLLSGWGGDEAVTFNGRGYFADLFRTARWLTLARELHLRSKLHGGNALLSALTSSILPNVPASLALRLPHIAQRHPSYKKVPPLPPELQPGLTELLKDIKPYDRESAYDVAGVHTMQRRLFQHGHITQRMESWYAHGERLGISYRYPLTDKRLLEFALGVPDDLFFKRGWKRYLFRRSLDGIVPEDLQWKKSKRDTSLIEGTTRLYQQLLEEKGLQSRVEMQREQLQKQQFVDADKLLTSLNQLQPDSFKDFLKDDVHRALWLAFVGKDVFV
jgi:asparagine synthase (glutamine-hydrolysing)